MNSKKLGNVTELETILAFYKLGYSVLIPYGDCDRYDYVVDKCGKFIRIQCKTSRSYDGGSYFEFGGRSCHRKGGKVINEHYNETEIEYFATSFNGKCYLVPVNECGSAKRLRLLTTKNGQEKSVHFASDYELEKIAKSW